MKEMTNEEFVNTGVTHVDEPQVAVDWLNSLQQEEEQESEE